MKNWFEKIVGAENVSEEIVDKEVYSTDASRIKSAGGTRIVCFVETDKQIHQIILFAKRNKIDIVARGGGSNLVGSAVPDNSIVIDFSKMNKILKVGKDCAIVQPGITIDSLNEQLGDKMFPVIPLSSDITTIGGCVSMNYGSPRSFKYGRTSEWVVNAEIIDGTGRSRELRSKDICGSEGGIGLITKVKIKLIPKVTGVSYEIFSFNELEPLVEKVSMLRNRTDVLSIEFINSVAAQVCLFGDKNYLLVEYEGKGGVVVKDEIKKLLVKRANMRHLLFNADYKIIQDPVVPFNNLVEFLYWLKMNKVPCFGHLGNGVLHPVFKDLAKIKPMYVVVNRLGGEANGEFGIGLLNKEYVKENKKAEFKILKDKYDPENILNRGKLV